MATSTINARTIDSAKNPGQVTRAAQSQWYARPADQKYASLDALLAYVSERRDLTSQYDTDVRDLDFVLGTSPTGKDADRAIVTRALVQTGKVQRTIAMDPTHYAFGQLCSSLSAPAGYFREQLSERPDLVVAALNHGANKHATEGVKLMTVDRGETPRLAAVTSQSYGRIWDADVALAAQRILASNPAFYAPLDWGREKRALFASDRDVFMFFIDGGSIVDGGGDRDQLHRGFYLWNSEVGSKTFGIATFLFRQVCGNFGIWGAEDVRVMKIRHTSGGPERFVTDAIPALAAYTNASAKPLEEAVRKAKAYALPAKPDEFDEFFKNRGFNAAEVKRAVEHADAEEGQHITLWDMYNGFTAAARHLAYAEASVNLQKRAGELMTLVSGK
jgi:hypothetical protein